MLDDRGSLAAMAQAVSACDPDPEWKERILRGMTLVAMFDGNPDPQTLSLLDAAAEAFGVDARPGTTYRKVMLDRQTIVRFDIARRVFYGRQLKPRCVMVVFQPLCQTSRCSAAMGTAPWSSVSRPWAMIQRFVQHRGLL